jgi:two-component system, NtrC family, response regulator AtoC
MISPHVLVVGSEPATLHSLSAMLAGTSYRAEESTLGAEALLRVRRDPAPDLLLLALGGGNGKSLSILQQLRALRPDLAIVVLSASGDTREVVEAIRLGAQDYLNVPLQRAELQKVLLRHLRSTVSPTGTRSSDETIEQLDGDEFFVAASPEMHKVRLQSELLANIDVPVLILGESGTGKEITAHLIHKLSSRSQRRFLKVNCAALPGELLESELFGYERGAFTGATRTKPGKFELCDKGTILLDEVAEMPANLQAKLLHVLQDKRFFRLGGESTIEVDVRILAATNVNVHRAIAERKFREDLYYRLSAFTITLPPLRERQGEIPLLLRHFMGRMASQYSRPTIRLSPALIEACLRYPWPGNLRELENFVKRYLVMGDEATAITELRANWRPSQIAVDASSGASAVHLESVSVDGEVQGARVKASLRALKDETEVNAIARALKETRWNRKQAARLLNISYRGLLYKIRQHGITRLPGSESKTYVRNGNRT